jgi:hypothetical protein
VIKSSSSSVTGSYSALGSDAASSGALISSPAPGAGGTEDPPTNSGPGLSGQESGYSSDKPEHVPASKQVIKSSSSSASGSYSAAGSNAASSTASSGQVIKSTGLSLSGEESGYSREKREQLPASRKQVIKSSSSIQSSGSYVPEYKQGPFNNLVFSFDIGNVINGANITAVEVSESQIYAAGYVDDLTIAYMFFFSKDGTLLKKVPQPSANWGSIGWRDLAFDGEYLYAGDAQAAPGMITQISADTGEPTGVYISTPLNLAEALAYDRSSDSFWVASGSSLLYNVDRQGNILAAHATDLGEISGLAMEESSTNGQVLWIWSKEGQTWLQATQFDPGAGAFTGEIEQIRVEGLISAGGAAAYNDFQGSGKWVLATVHKGSSQVLQGVALAGADAITEISRIVIDGPPVFNVVRVDLDNPYVGFESSIVLSNDSPDDVPGLLIIGLGDTISSGPLPGFGMMKQVLHTVPIILAPGSSEIKLAFPSEAWFTNLYLQFVQGEVKGGAISGSSVSSSDVLKVFLGGPAY